MAIGTAHSGQRPWSLNVGLAFQGRDEHYIFPESGGSLNFFFTMRDSITKTEIGFFKILMESNDIGLEQVVLSKISVMMILNGKTTRGRIAFFCF